MGLLWLYAGLALANVIAHLADVGAAATVTKPLLMPVLAAWLLTTAPRTRLVRLVALGLGLSWLGDLALMGDGETWFLLGIGGFALAQGVYVAAFLPLARTGLVRDRPVLIAPYAVLWLAMMPLLAPHVGGLLVPVAVYGLLLTAMAALALGVNRTVAIGAALFVVSDAVLAVTSLAGLSLPASGAVVMATYAAAQGLIAVGCRARVRAPDPPVTAWPATPARPS